MAEMFPEPIRKLPQADIPISGVTAYLSQSDAHQILFMEFDEDVEIPEHSLMAEACANDLNLSCKERLS